jgi:hypothetical protein
VLIIENQEHFDKVREFARSVGAEAELQKQLDFLAGFGGDAAKVRCHLSSDFAPHSFFWRMEHSSLDGWKPGLVGGLIYSGPGVPSDGSAPSFSVSLNPDAASGRKRMGIVRKTACWIAGVRRRLRAWLRSPIAGIVFRRLSSSTPCGCTFASP